MVDVYISWCEGLGQDPVARHMIAECPFVAGVETAGPDDQVLPFLEDGIPVSVHNTTRWDIERITDARFKENFLGPKGERLTQQLKRTRTPFMGFHLDHGYNHKEQQHIIDVIVQNVRFMNQLIPELTVLIEGMPFHRNKITNDELYVAMTNPLFLQELFRQLGNANVNVGYLLDTGHTIVAADSMVHMKKYHHSLHRYAQEIITAVGDENIRQLHLHVPTGNEQVGFQDVHGTFMTGKEAEPLVLGIGRDVVARCPNLDVVTIEVITKDIEPVDHVSLLMEQTQYVREKLDI